MFNQRQPEALKSELKAFQNFLECRQEDLCRSEISMISTKLETNIRDWLRTESRLREEDLRECSKWFYFLDCPNLHAVPFHVLQAWMNQDVQQTEVSQSLQEWPAYIIPLGNLDDLCWWAIYSARLTNSHRMLKKPLDISP